MYHNIIFAPVLCWGKAETKFLDRRQVFATKENILFMKWAARQIEISSQEIH